jgi:4-amino-4-deoxy-L-arabinose transferase-like glycosyltransferase
MGILGVAGLFFALRWNNFDAPMGRDEGEYAYGAQLIIQGIAPYQHAYIQKPPGIIYTYAFSNLLLPNYFWSPRILVSLFTGLAAILLGLTARREFGGGYALPVIALTTPMILLPGLDQVDANVEMFMLLPLVAVVAIYSYSRNQGNKDAHWLAAGLTAGIALLYKYTAVPILAFIFWAWLIELWWSHRKAGPIFRALAWMTAGGILAAALELVFFLVHDGGKSFWECTVTFNRYYAGSNDTGSFGLGILWSKCQEFWHSWWILFLMPWAIFLKPPPRTWFWVGTFIAALLSTSGSCYNHYYIPLMPFWALLNVMGIHALASWVSAQSVKPLPRLSGWITIIILILVLHPDAYWMLCSRKSFAEEKTVGYPYLEAQWVAKQISGMSSPNDFVYVAGSEPEILCYAKRFSPTRFITTYTLMAPTPLAEGYQHEAISELQQHPPKLIVFVQSGYSWTRETTTPPDFLIFLGKFLSQDYEIAGGYVKRDGQKGYWATKLSHDEFMNSTLWLYKRKL